MKLNKWTMSLAALGVVSLASAAKAQEATEGNFVQTALSSTIISGYVDTSVEWMLHPSHEDFPSAFYGGGFRDGKEDGFNLNVVKLRLEKPLDESEWASGYTIDLLFGPDAVGYNNSAWNDGDVDESFSIKQAYVALRTPVGNGIDWKVGVFDTVIGYEVFEAGNNPNFTRSYGWSIEPTQHTGILGTYQISDMISVAGGVANTLTPGINARNTEDGNDSYWCKTFMGSVAITAPEDMGFLAGSTIYGGVVHGFAGGSEDQVNYYTGATIATPVAGLTTGFAFDYVTHLGGSDVEAMTYGLYASFQATEKLSVHGRAEYGHADLPGSFSGGADAIALTGTVQYDLWANVISRLELRYDHLDEDAFGSDNEIWGAFANIIYTF